MATTMKDVARQAGVDVSTVSLAINNDPRIRIETRERILLIAHDLSYRKNLLARGLRSGKSFTVGAIVEGASPLWNEVLVGAHTALEPRDYHLLVDYLCDASPRGEARQIDALKAKRIDGFLIAPADERGVDDDNTAPPLDTANDYKVLRDEHIPFVFVDRHILGVDADLVAIDNADAMETAVRYLTELGHRGIAYLYAPCRMNSAESERLHAYEFAMRSAGIAPMRIAAPSRASASDVQAGQEGVQEMLAHPRGQGVTALIAASDSLALGALRALESNSLAAPRDMSIVAIGGSPIVEHVRPALTTISISMRDVGFAAASLLYERIQGDPSSYREIRLPATLTIRGSCAPPRQRGGTNVAESKAASQRRNTTPAGRNTG